MIALIITAAIFTVGITAYIKVFIPVITIASVSGMWLFFIQHQFKKVYWSRADTWDPVKAPRWKAVHFITFLLFSDGFQEV